MPCTLLVLDEIQQFIGQDAQTALDVQEVTEALSKDMDGRQLGVKSTIDLCYQRCYV